MSAEFECAAMSGIGDDDSAVSLEDVLIYVSEMLKELREVTDGAGLSALSYFIQIAYEEAMAQKAMSETCDNEFV